MLLLPAATACFQDVGRLEARPCSDQLCQVCDLRGDHACLGVQEGDGKQRILQERNVYIVNILCYQVI